MNKSTMQIARLFDVVSNTFIHFQASFELHFYNLSQEWGAPASKQIQLRSVYHVLFGGSSTRKERKESKARSPIAQSYYARRLD